MIRAFVTRHQGILTVALVLFALAGITLFATGSLCPAPRTAAEAAPAPQAAAASSAVPAPEEVKAPDFELETLDGDVFRLEEQRGKVVVLNFWATWCPPCRAEIPDFIELQEELGRDAVVFAGISLDEEGWDVVRPFAERLGINYPLMVDDGAVSRAYGPLQGLPTTFVIDQEGHVEHYAPGMVTEQTLRPALEQMLAP